MRIVITFFTAFLMVFFSVGCQKEINHTLSEIKEDSSATESSPIALLKQIKVQHLSVSDPIDITFSIQYDTVNRKINVYWDDTTNTNLYDLLVYTYEFNKDGYLTKSQTLGSNGALKTDFTISRNSSNQIQQIIEFDAEEINNATYNDTIHYSYQTASGQTIIRDSVRFFPFTKFASQTVTYNAQNKPVLLAYRYDGLVEKVQSFHYNNQNLLNRIEGSTDTIDYAFDAMATDTNWQKQSQLFLGKDYYILSIEPLTQSLSYNFLSFIVEGTFETTYNPLLTLPLSSFRRSGYVVTDPDHPQTQLVNFTNSYTVDHKLASILLTPVGGEPFYYSFSYE